MNPRVDISILALPLPGQPLRYQQQLAGSLSRLQIAMRTLSFFQLVDVRDAQLQFARSDHIEDIARTLLQFLPAGNVMHQRWPGEEQRSLLRQLDGIKRRNRSAGAAEQNQVSARAQDVEVLIESTFAHAVIDHVDSFAAGQAFG